MTLSQVGYALGLALLVPLGDMLERRRLLPGVLLVTTAGLVASRARPASACSLPWPWWSGAGSTVAQMLVPMAASLATESRGRVVGMVMCGLLLGILLARTVSGLVAGITSWRMVYVVAAVLMVVRRPWCWPGCSPPRAGVRASATAPCCVRPSPCS